MKRRSEAQWRALFDEHVTSGQTAAAFCRLHGVCPKYFSLRRRQLRQPGAASTQSAFVCASLVSPAADFAIEIQLNTGLRLRLTTVVPPQWLAALLLQLQD
jgi:transposase-like protein